jgi:hypothetical protein
MALLLGGACDRAEPAPTPAGRPAAAAPAARPDEPTAGDREYARLTAAWTPAALEGCARQLRDVLGTRDLVQGALDGVKDPAGKAAAEMEDARAWIAKGDSSYTRIAPRLESGACDGDVTVALDETWQLYVKAGTSAVQAGQIAGS